MGGHRDRAMVEDMVRMRRDEDGVIIRMEGAWSKDVGEVGWE